ncbi:Transcription factor SPEECHLESS [Platanthera guangdongensis]|uniref:Transcription factor SPEECHLESS n=1 Tax=Platanthera guangdongensis TaxID=2320717 RepID=A0ABR2LF29_9ASPA
MGDALSEIFQDPEFRSISLAGAAAAASPENLFSILETLQDINGDVLPFSMLEEPIFSPNLIDDRTVMMRTTSPDSNALNTRSSRRCETDEEEENGGAGVSRRKKMKLAAEDGAAAEEGQEGQPKVSHIAVERNRRKQMNEHLVVLRSLMPCFYVKRRCRSNHRRKARKQMYLLSQAAQTGALKAPSPSPPPHLRLKPPPRVENGRIFAAESNEGDQASIIGGVVDYIKELQQLLKSLEAKKQRKAYSEVLSSPRPPLSSPPPLAVPRMPPSLPPSPRRPSPLCSPRVCPSTPQPALMSPNYMPKSAQPCIVLSPSKAASSHESSASLDADHQLAAGNYRSSKVAAAAVEVKLSGPNVVLNTASHRIPGHALKIITVLEGLALEILHVSISTMEDTMLFSFTIKIGIECELSAEELAQEIQQTFS